MKPPRRHDREWEQIPPDEPFLPPPMGDSVYCTARMAAQREQSDSVCIDEGCELSGGYAHAGPCEPCRCGKEHAIEECPVLAKPRFPGNEPWICQWCGAPQPSCGCYFFRPVRTP